LYKPLASHIICCCMMWQHYQIAGKP